MTAATTPVLHRIESAAVDATPALASVGRCIAASPIQTLSLSAEELARQAGTSVAAVNRFSQAAGFAGFADLKSALAHDLQSATAPVRKLEQARRTRGRDSIDIDAVLEAARSVKIERVADRLLKAPQVWILGLGLTSYVAGYAAHAFTPYLRKAYAVAGAGGTEVAARNLSTLDKGDVLLAMSLPRYSRDTVQMAAFARRRGAYVVAITDAQTAPIARESDVVLLVPASHPVLPATALGLVGVVEALVAAVMVRNPQAKQLAREVADLTLAHLYSA